MTLSIRSYSHRSLSRFVDWIVTPEEREADIRKQADDIRKRVAARANEDGLTVLSTPEAGSFAKKTGLRRHMLGKSQIEGQDVDVPFVVSAAAAEGKSLDRLLEKFESYAQAIYPNTSRHPTKSSVQLSFTGTRINYDIVPMLSVSGDEEAQILIRRDGERRATSVQKHVRFVKVRTAKSNEAPGRVKFNECVRLVKWWREWRQSESQVLGEVPTIVVELLCAKAFDDLGVQETYTDTLAQWFSRMARAVKMREPVWFTDYAAPRAVQPRGRLVLLDPVNPENDVVPPGWGGREIEELASWLSNARDRMVEVQAADAAGNLGRSKVLLTGLLGAPFASHGSVEQ